LGLPYIVSLSQPLLAARPKLSNTCKTPVQRVGFFFTIRQTMQACWAFPLAARPKLSNTCKTPVQRVHDHVNVDVDVHVLVDVAGLFFTIRQIMQPVGPSLYCALIAATPGCETPILEPL
jgi:hypothetical protein